ncbi:alpha-1,6- mannosyltransferase [Gnomoniopsis sp. IMI 355080]|nr:alpha-1,6- mannosyltransferase [Gnomoniopsis sp. IMI 355080]
MADALFDLLIIAVVLVNLLSAPYTKVEESFNIQATHDVLVYGAPLSNIHQKLSSSYDHFTFPGAVPRTFIGPLFTATFSQPLVALVGFQHAQLIARALLGLFNAGALIFFRAQLQGACGPSASRWYAALQASQFHLMFYASRTLPNMFAFGLTTVAFGLLLPSNNPNKANRRTRMAVMLFVFSAVVFRSEVALLLATNALWLLIIPQTSLGQLIPPFAVSFILSVAVTVLVDSYFWQKLLWPELWGFYYNVIQGSSSNWGTSPFYYYFTSAIPKLLLNPLGIPLILVALWSPAYYRIAQRFVIPNLLFVAIYSIQPHKEARFIFYVVPPLTAAAALGAASLTKAAPAKDKGDGNPKPTLIKQVSTLVLAASILATFIASGGMLLISTLNYPGGEALAALNAIIRVDQPVVDSSIVAVHADVLSCMTGVTRFGVSGDNNVPTRHNFASNGDLVVAGHSDGSDNSPAAWLTLDKTEEEAELAVPGFWLRFDYLLMEDERAVKGGFWDTVAVVEGYAGIEVLKPGVELEEGALGGVRRVGRGAQLTALRDRVRMLTGGWWVGPKLSPKIRIMKRRGTAAAADKATEMAAKAA